MKKEEALNLIKNNLNESIKNSYIIEIYDNTLLFKSQDFPDTILYTIEINTFIFASIIEVLLYNGNNTDIPLIKKIINPKKENLNLL